MSSRFQVVLVAFVLLEYCHGLVNIGKYLKICERNSVDVNDCLVEAVQEGLGVMAKGIPDFGVPAVDPYVQKELRINYNNNQIQVKFVAKNIIVEGLKDATVHDVRLRADDDRFHLEIDLSTPRVHVSGNYQGEGRYNSLKLVPFGKFDTNMTDLVFTWKIDGVPEKKENGTFVRVNDFYMRPDVGEMKTYLSNNDVESRDLTNLGTQFTNNNWRLLYRELLPFAQSNWNRIGIRVCNKIFLKVPYNELFPISP